MYIDRLGLTAELSEQKADDKLNWGEKFGGTRINFVDSFSKSQKQYYATVCAVHLDCTKAHKTTFSRSGITSMTNFRIKYPSCVSKFA